MHKLNVCAQQGNVSLCVRAYTGAMKTQLGIAVVGWTGPSALHCPLLLYIIVAAHDLENVQYTCFLLLNYYFLCCCRFYCQMLTLPVLLNRIQEPVVQQWLVVIASIYLFTFFRKSSRNMAWSGLAVRSKLTLKRKQKHWNSRCCRQRTELQSMVALVFYLGSKAAHGVMVKGYDKSTCQLPS